jgi:hypothetical protein
MMTIGETLIYQAMLLREAMTREPDRARGLGAVAMRKDIEQGWDLFGMESETLAERMKRSAAFTTGYLKKLEPRIDQEITSDDTSVLIDALCFKKGFRSRAQAWESLGVSPNTGAGWCNPAKPGIKRWPAFAALRTAVLEEN